jgi:hypothetical protein
MTTQDMTRLFGNILDTLAWEDSTALGRAIAEKVDYEELNEDDLRAYIAEVYDPEDIFDADELEEWAKNNMEIDDFTPGYGYDTLEEKYT